MSLIVANSDIEDSLTWSFSADGVFSVKSAFSYLENIQSIGQDWNWSCVWKLEAIPRVHFFCWFLVLNKLLTNAS